MAYLAFTVHVAEEKDTEDDCVRVPLRKDEAMHARQQQRM